MPVAGRFQRLLLLDVVREAAVMLDDVSGTAPYCTAGLSVCLSVDCKCAPARLCTEVCCLLCSCRCRLLLRSPRSSQRPGGHLVTLLDNFEPRSLSRAQVSCRTNLTCCPMIVHLPNELRR